MWERIRPWLFPVTCLGCETGSAALCAGCAPLPADRIVDVVGGVRLIAVGSYDGVLRRAIVAMKRGERAYLDPFAQLLAMQIVPGAAIVALPTSRRQRAARGFDQGVELARRAALRCGSPYYDVLLKRGLAQRGLGRRARLEAERRFRLRPDAALPEAAIVVDDVCTTGATLSDGIATLRAAGVAVVGAVVLARTSPGRNSRGRGAVTHHGDHRTLRSSLNVKAIWNGTVIAESDVTEVVEGNHYFPLSAIKREFFTESPTHSTCPWKGVASYYSVEVDGKTNTDAAWYYPTPKDAAKNITGHVAFWKGVEVSR